MAKFQGNLRDSKGNSVQQTITAASLKVARDTWKQKGFVVQEVKEVKGGFDFAALTMKKVAVKDLALFSRQLATLVNAGVSMVRGLGVMVDQCSNPTLKIALTEVLDDVQQGTNFSDGLRKHPKVFDKLFCAMIQAGETGGVLDDVLSRMATLLEDSARLNNQIKSAMTYPIVVCSIA
ncbi:MAG: type II secretion system F family protein, partial [Pseudanabaena sp. ELA748]